MSELWFLRGAGEEAGYSYRRYEGCRNSRQVRLGKLSDFDPPRDVPEKITGPDIEQAGFCHERGYVSACLVNIKSIDPRKQVGKQHRYV